MDKDTQHTKTTEVTFVVDRVLVQIVVARYEDGRKVEEVPFNTSTLFYPFALSDISLRAVKEARAQWEQANGGGQ